MRCIWVCRGSSSSTSLLRRWPGRGTVLGEALGGGEIGVDGPRRVSGARPGVPVPEVRLAIAGGAGAVRGVAVRPPARTVPPPAPLAGIGFEPRWIHPRPPVLPHVDHGPGTSAQWRRGPPPRPLPPAPPPRVRASCRASSAHSTHAEVVADHLRVARLRCAVPCPAPARKTVAGRSVRCRSVPAPVAHRSRLHRDARRSAQDAETGREPHPSLGDRGTHRRAGDRARHRLGRPAPCPSREVRRLVRRVSSVLRGWDWRSCERFRARSGGGGGRPGCPTNPTRTSAASAVGCPVRHRVRSSAPPPCGRISPRSSRGGRHPRPAHRRRGVAPAVDSRLPHRVRSAALPSPGRRAGRSSRGARSASGAPQRRSVRRCSLPSALPPP